MKDAGSQASKRALIITFYFPPFHRSSGILRTLKFVRYLADFGYEPIVLTASPRAYDTKDDQILAQIPANVGVARTFALDTKKHLSIRGAYFDFMAWPDRYVSWIPAAVWEGMNLVHDKKIDVIFSTYPVASAHLVGLLLHRMTRRPWIADFRDPVWDAYSPFNNKLLKIKKNIERKAVRNASCVVVTTEGMRQLFRERYKEMDAKRLKVITNGYDEIDFEGIERSERRTEKSVHLIHAGLLDPHDRNPEPFFKGIALLLQRGGVRRDDLVVELIAPGNEGDYQQAIDKFGLGGVIKLQGSVPYKEALQNMAAADILLLFQGESCAHQIPAKAYEYLRTGRPIFALTPATSDTARLILEASAGAVVPPDQPETIAVALEQWIANLKQGIALPAASLETAAKHSRKEQTKLLAQCFDAILDEKRGDCFGHASRLANCQEIS